MGIGPLEVAAPVNNTGWLVAVAVELVDVANVVGAATGGGMVGSGTPSGQCQWSP